MDEARAVRLFLDRWVEQLESTFVPRRARTLSTVAALDELLGLAEGFVRSGGVTRPAIDPDDGGHGVLMVPDVASEACELVKKDEFLRAAFPTRRDAIVDVLNTLKTKADVTAERLATLRPLVSALKADLMERLFETSIAVVQTKPGDSKRIVQLAESTVSELRYRGWSDEALLAAGKRSVDASSNDSVEALQALAKEVSATKKSFRCFVALALPKARPPFPSDDPTFALVDELPARSEGRPMKQGPYASVSVEAYDAHSAAANAHRRVLSTVGALTVFLRDHPADIKSDVIAVSDGSSLTTVELKERLVEEKRSTTEEQQAHILRSAWTASGKRSGDPLHDALRLRHRALIANDADSRLLLLWSSIERMTAGADGYSSALSASRELVAHAIALGKLRRDVAALSTVIRAAAASDPAKMETFSTMSGSDAKKALVSILRSNETALRELTDLVHDSEPLLAYRCYELWEAFGSGSDKPGTALADYFERSRERVGRQVARIYRARNRIAHVGDGAERVRDLVWHAHFYLTQLIAICIHYSTDKPAPPQDILLARLGNYKAFMLLLRKNDPQALLPETLLRPSTLVTDRL